MNVHIPRNLYNFMVVFQGDMLSMIPNPLAASENTLQCVPKGKFEEMGTSCSFINNSGVFMAILIIMSVLKILVFTLSKFWKKEGKVKSALGFCNRTLGAGFIINYIFMFELDIGLAAVLELTSKEGCPFYEIFGDILAISILILIPIVTAIVARLSYLARKNRPGYEGWISLKENIRKKVLIFGFYTPEIQAIRDLLIPTCIVLFHDYPFFQILATMINIGAPLFLKMLVMPYDSKHENFFQILNEILYCLILIEFLLLLSIQSTMSISAFNTIGYLAIGKVMMIAACNVL